MDNKIENIKKMILEIESCLSNQEYLSALTCSSIIPDACGQLENINYKSNIEKYTYWFDIHIGQFEQSPLAEIDNDWRKIPYTDGYRIYKLRCNLLHEATPSLPQITEWSDDELPIDIFDLDWEGKYCTMGGITKCVDGHMKTTLRINVPEFCNIIVAIAKGFIRTFEEKNK